MIDDKFDFNQVDIVRGTARKTDTQIHTRVMVEDADVPVYTIETSAIDEGNYFDAFDSEIFLAKLFAEHPEVESNGVFYDKITATAGTSPNIIIKAVSTQSSTEITLGTGDPDSSTFQAQMQDWGITVNRGFGTLRYYTDSGHTQVSSLKLASLQDVLSLSPGESATSGWVANINGKNVPNADMVSVTLNDRVTAIPENFLYSCQALTYADMSSAPITAVPAKCCMNSTATDIKLPTDSNYSIGDDFARGCTSLTSVGRTPNRSSTSYLDGVTTIGKNFLYGCTAFAYTLYLPNTLTMIDTGFMYQCKNFQELKIPLQATFTLPSGDKTFLSCTDKGSLMGQYGVHITYSTAADNSTPMNNIRKFIAAGPIRDSSPYRAVIPYFGYASVISQGTPTIILTQAQITAMNWDGSSTTGNVWSTTVAEGRTITDTNLLSIVVGQDATFPNNFLRASSNLTTVDISRIRTTSLPNYFLHSSRLTSLSLSPRITTIGTYFMYYCRNFNQSLAFNALTTVGASAGTGNKNFTGWFYGAQNFCATLTFSVLTVSGTWTASNEAFAASRNTHAEFTTGITIQGTAKAKIMSVYPNSTGGLPYRKLI